MTTRDPSNLSERRGRTPAWVTMLTCLALALAILAVYAQTFGFGLVDLDDHGYVGGNSGPVNGGLTASSFIWAFTETHMANWHPLTWLSYLLDRTISPQGAGIFHVTNVLLHVANTLALYCMLRMLTGAHWPSAMVAALHALHPAHVESVAWISERKDVLSTLLWFATMWAYGRYAGAAGRGLGWYVWTCVIFALGLLAKPMLVTLPCVLLLLDVWPLRRIGSLRDLLRCASEKTPLLALSLASSVVTIIAQRSEQAMVGTTLLMRAENAVIAGAQYVRMLFWPSDLSVMYPHRALYGQPTPPWWVVALCGLMLAGVTALAIALRRRLPQVLVGWLWFGITLSPVIGLLVQVGVQARADRYTYIPYIGLYIALVWMARAAIMRWRIPAWSWGACAALWLAILGFRAWQQAGLWRDSATLFEHALRIDPDNFRAHEMYAVSLTAQKRHADAEWHLQRCVELCPTYINTRMDLGNVLAAQGRMAEAARTFERVLEIDAQRAPAHFNLGQLLMIQGERSRGLLHLERAVELDPANALYRECLSRARATQP